MRMQKIKIYCQTKDCSNYKKINWNGDFLQKWLCCKCKQKIMKKFNNEKQ